MKIICIGRNYKKHIEELKNEIPGNPVIFLKPESSLSKNNKIAIPKILGEVHYECEVVLKIDKDIPLETCKIETIQEVVSEWTLGIDFTARDLQSELKAKGLPWELAKAFENSAVVGKFIPINKKSIYDCEFDFLKNDELVQKGALKNLLFDFEQLIRFINQYFSLEKGDLIFTGTPEGVGKISISDKYIGKLDSQTILSISIV